MAFFSGTDNEAIKQEAMNCNHFLSLVVDTRGTYVARITKRNLIKQTVHQTIKEEFCYPTYEDKLICVEQTKEETKDFTKELAEIVVFPLKIEVEKYEAENVAEWEADLKEAAHKPAPTPAKPQTTNPNLPTKEQVYALAKQINQGTKYANQSEIPFPEDKEDDKSFDEYNKEFFGDVRRQPSLAFSSPNNPERKSTMEIDTEYDPVDLDKFKECVSDNDIKYIALQLVSCNLFIDRNKVNMLPNYATNLPQAVKQRFEEDTEYFALVDLFIEGIMENYCEGYPFIATMDEFMCYVAMEVQNLLLQLPKNKYVDHISNQLDAYLV